MDEKEQEKRDLAIIDAALEKLTEHFDAAHIFVCRHEHNPRKGGSDGTLRMAKGAGNWMARYGQIRQWMIGEEEAVRCDMREHMKKDED